MTAKVPHNAQELDRAEARLDEAIKRSGHRWAEAREDLEAIEAEIPEAALEAFVTGDNGALDDLMERRRAAERDIAAHEAISETHTDDRRATWVSFWERQIRIQRKALAGEAPSGLSYRRLPAVLVDPDTGEDRKVA